MSIIPAQQESVRKICTLASFSKSDKMVEMLTVVGLWEAMAAALVR